MEELQQVAIAPTLQETRTALEQNIQFENYGSTTNFKDFSQRPVRPNTKVFCRISRTMEPLGKGYYDLFLQQNTGSEILLMSAEKHLGLDGKYHITTANMQGKKINLGRVKYADTLQLTYHSRSNFLGTTFSVFQNLGGLECEEIASVECKINSSRAD